MNRHYRKPKLFNQTGHPVDLFAESVWDLPPYVIARFGGELTQVMLTAAQQYLSERCLHKQQQVFEKAAFAPRK